MRFLYALLFLMVLMSCSDSRKSLPEDAADTPLKDAGVPATEPQKIVETFNTGPHVVVRSLAVEDENNRLWVGTSHGVLEVGLDTSEVQNVFTRDHGLANEYVFAIGIDSRDYKWFGTNAGGVSRYKEGQWDTFFPMHGLADYWVYSFAEQSDGTFWVGTWAGVNKVNLETLEMTTYVDELVNEWVYGIGVDSKDRLWFGTEGGVTRFDGKEWRHWAHEDGLGAPNTSLLSHSKNTGLGTRSRHDLNVSVDGGESYNPNYVFSLLVAENDDVWCGTWGGGVAHFDGKSWHNFTDQDGLAGNIVYSIARDSQGTFWFGTNHGLSRYDGDTWHTYDRENGMLGNDVYAITPASNGDIWAGTKGGVMRLAYD